MSRLFVIVFGAWLLAGWPTSKALAADAIPGEQWCNREVAEIQFSGNKVTQAAVLRRELLQQSGTMCSLDDIIDGIQAIMDLGLFKSVRAELQLNAEKDLQLRYIVKEKIFFLPIPRLSRTSDGQLRYGAQLRWDNFLGRLYQLKITWEKRQDDNGRGRTGYVNRLEYTVPRFLDTRYGMRLRVGRERRNTEISRDGIVYGEALRDSRVLEMRLSRWSSETGGVSGLSYFLGADIEDRVYEVNTGRVGPFRDGQKVALVAGFALQDVHQEQYRRTGQHYSASVEVSNKALGSDFSYARLDATAQWFIALQRPQTNLNIQARLGLSDRAPFGERSYSLGGGEVLRGMTSDKSSGNLMTLVNIEYLRGLFAYPAWRWVLFVDAGNVYLNDDVDLLRQQARVGVGLRWKLESLTNTDIRLDLAWDPDKEGFRSYFSTSLTF